MKNALLGLIIGLIIGGGFIHYRNHNFNIEKNRLQGQLIDLNTALQQSQLQNQTLETQLSLDQATQKALEKSLGEKQDEIGRLRDQLAFYDHLLPLSDNGTVHIRALNLDLQSADLLHYKLLLQRPAGLERFNGHMQFTAHGQQDGKSVNIVLNTAGADPADTTVIEFDQFLRTTGLLNVPPTLKIDTVTLHIYQGKQLRATHKMDFNPN